jgi:hypothetical protein
MTYVYIANFGEGNRLWPRAKAKNVLITTDDVLVHDFWRAGDRAGYIDAAIAHTVTALGVRPTRPTAGRWFNVIDELRDTDGDLWISRQGEALWWTVSLPDPMRETFEDFDDPRRGIAKTWMMEKPCRPWSDRDGEGRPLRWKALHPKAHDFLSTEATFQKLAEDRGYADYARALVAGEPLDLWERSPVWVAKAQAAKTQKGRIFSPRELAAERMARMMLATVAGANGQIVERRVKEKTTTLSQLECEALIRKLMGEQEDLCALTGLPLGYDRDCDDTEMLASLDRIDSAGHYTPDNVQIVCRFINRWKGDDDDSQFRRLLGVLRSGVTH